MAIENSHESRIQHLERDTVEMRERIAKIEEHIEQILENFHYKKMFYLQITAGVAVGVLTALFTNLLH